MAEERDNGAFPLYYASLGGFYDLAEHLIGKHPEQINARGGQMVTPLVAALWGKHFRVAELLHRHGADVDVRDHFGITPLFEAFSDGDETLDIAQWLLNHGADANARDHWGQSPLHSAAKQGHLQAFQMLIEHNPDIHALTNYGVSLLHIAAGSLHSVGIMQVLLDRGADPNARDKNNSTPLHYSSRPIVGEYSSQARGATKGETVEGTRLLLKHGAIIDAENKEGKTPLQLALEEGRDDMATCLKEHGATR